MQVRHVTHGLALHEVIGCLLPPRKKVSLASSPLGPSINVHPGPLCVCTISRESSHRLQGGGGGTTLTVPLWKPTHSSHSIDMQRASVVERKPCLALIDGTDFVFHCMLSYNNQPPKIPAGNPPFNSFLHNYFSTHPLNRCSKEVNGT